MLRRRQPHQRLDRRVKTDTTKTLTAVLSMLQQQFEQGHAESKANGLILELVVSLLMEKHPDLRHAFAANLKVIIESTDTSNHAVLAVMQKYYGQATAQVPKTPEDWRSHLTIVPDPPESD